MREVALGTRFGEPAVAVFASGTQHDDGRIDDGTMERSITAQSIYIDTIDEDGGRTDTGITLTRESALLLADVLVTAAAELERWI